MPECSCRRCLEAMLREYRPTLLVEEITITRVGPGAEPPSTQRRAA